MKPKTAIILNLLISLMFAATIIYFDEVTNWLIALWLIPFTLLSAVGIKSR